jgi:RND family efflux transporter MFP subunit
MSALLLALFLAQTTAATPGAVTAGAPEAMAGDALQALSSVPGHLCVVVARKEVNVAPQVSGVLAAVDVELGDRVQRGQVLFRIDDQPLQHEVAMARAAAQSAEADVTRARVARDEAQRRDQRRQEAADVYSSEDRERASSEAEMAQAELQSAEANLAEQRAHLSLLESNLNRTRVKAPFTGAVAGRFQQVGASVSSATPVVRLIATAAPYVRFAVPPAEAAHFAPDAPLQITFADRALPVRARVLGLAPEVDSAIEMVLVEAELAEDDPGAAEIRVGMVGKVTR